ncbi:hypothetical protein N7495_000907 [Penicillium taxi]|uniref:uncharacterized protein n=1 Tax=Penicillium taxi TaxID=168475 RepID=UPI0025457CB6|nr:uncharacterized protein N7495_000907 [Penicillium taxi]KAJ5908225.1 hypothetical protein N7495_000907 [Penicillium taxi]
MAAPRISALFPPEAEQWRHLLRTTLRECTYLPDPIARAYMRSHVMERYRRARDSRRPKSKMVRTAKQGLSFLRRANEGYPRMLDKVMFMSYGRTGKRRHELLDRMMKIGEGSTPIPENADAVRRLIIDSRGGWAAPQWEAPEIVIALVKSQKNNGVVTSSRIRPHLKAITPTIPATNSWGRPLNEARIANIRKKWYYETLTSLLPPLPEEELDTLEKLVSGTVPWKPVKRRGQISSSTQIRDPGILDFLVDGPQKGPTFREYVNGRPHEITPRFMHRLWMRISGFVPRMQWIPISKKWRFTWDSPKAVPQLTFNVDEGADLDYIFGGQQPQPKGNRNRTQARL